MELIKEYVLHDIFIKQVHSKGANNLIKCLKRIAFGYKKYDLFIARVFLIKGIIEDDFYHPL